jgi:abortive infection bacteriophage resistance protein
MAVNKVSRTIAEQITLLKTRGMLMKDEQKMAFYLNHINYFRLKGYWWDMQADRINHIFHPNVYFEDVIARYHFDRQLRLILFDAIEFIEIALRTKLIYHLSQAYGGLWYLGSAEKPSPTQHYARIETGASGTTDSYCPVVNIN